MGPLSLSLGPGELLRDVPRQPKREAGRITPRFCSLLCFSPLALHFAPNFSPFRDGSRVCNRNSHSGVLVTGLASTPPHPGTRAQPVAQGLCCPIVFTPTQSYLLFFFFFCPHNSLCWSTWKESLAPYPPRSVCWPAPQHPDPGPANGSGRSGEKFRYAGTISLARSGYLCLGVGPRGAQLGVFLTFHTLESAGEPFH